MTTESNMATNGRGQLRPHSANRSPPYIFVGLFVVIAILGFNYWNVSSKHTMLRRELDRSIDDVKRYEMKKLSLEKINANLLDTVKKNEAETKQINDELKVNKDQLQLKSSEYEKLKSENDQLKQEMDATRQEVQASAQYLLICQNNVTAQVEQFKVLRDEYASKLEELKGQTSNCESQCKQMMSDVHQKILRYVQKVLGDKAIIALQQQGLDVSGITLTQVQPGAGTLNQPGVQQPYQTQNQAGLAANQQQQQGTMGNQNPGDQVQGQQVQGQPQGQQVQGLPQNPATATQTQQDTVSTQNQPQAQGQGDLGQQADQGQQGQSENQPQGPVNVQSPPVVLTNQVGLGPMGNVQQNQSKGQESTEATAYRNSSDLAANEKLLKNNTANQPSAADNDQQKQSNQIPQTNSSNQVQVAEHVTSNYESTVTQSPQGSQANLQSKVKEDLQPKAVEPEEEDGKDAEEDEEDEAELRLPKESRQAPSGKQRGQMNLDEDTEVIGEGQQGQGQEEGQEEGQDGNGNRDYVGQQQEDQANQKLRFDPVAPAKEVIGEQNSIDRMSQGEQPQAREDDEVVPGLS